MVQQPKESAGVSTKKDKRKRLLWWILLAILAIIIVPLVALSFLPLNPVTSVINTIGFAATGRLHLPTQRIGEIVTDEEGRQFTIFREVVVDPSKDQPEHPGAMLILHFRVTNMSPEQNRLYSLLPLPLYIGDPGFRSKLFTINGEECQSIYEWDTAQEAENYVNSVALKTILMRSVPGSVSHKIMSIQK